MWFDTLPVWLDILLLTGLAGLCIPVGGMLATITRLRPQWLEREYRHFVIAFGGGILLGAVAVVLVPEGIAHLQGSLWSVGWLLLGGLVFFALERYLGLRRREAPQFTGMLLDYIPESIALGGMMAAEAHTAALLALLIGLQNLPEGFNTYRELQQIHGNRQQTLRLMFMLVPMGPLFGLLGYAFLAQQALGALMLVAAGGILYLIFQDIAPQARLRRHWAPPLGAVLGFALALAGNLLAGG
jgi:ZIP family zinc transporter